MRDFDYRRAGHLSDALATGGEQVLAGGTDLMTLIKEGLTDPAGLVDISRIPELAGISADGDGLRIGALTTLADLAAAPAIRERYTALAQAAESAATPQLRHMATIGGNLLQQPRCRYYRSGIPCFMSGGSGCPALEGENAFHAVFFPTGEEQGPCAAVHPSDPAAALLALGARLHLQGPGGARAMDLADLFAAPATDRRSLTALEPGELITAIALPAPPDASAYHKAMDRKVWSFALVGCAIAVHRRGAQVQAARVALSGVARLPWRAAAAEAALAERGLDAAAADAAAAAAADGARPLAQNGYKVALVRALVRRTVLGLAEG